MLKYREEKRDLFTVDKSYYLAHCIASDLRMGAGIAVPMAKKFGLRRSIPNTDEPLECPTCVLASKRILNLITKSKSSGKPSYHTLGKALEKMREVVEENEIKKIAMPRIGCGIDGLSWEKVRGMIQGIFAELDIEILVCVR